MAKPTYAELKETTRADLFTQLATAERAGILPAQAVTTLAGSAGPSLRLKLLHLSQLLSRGLTLADAGRLQGVLLPWEARLVRVGEQSGGLATVLSALADHYANRARAFRKIKGRLLFPYIVLIIGLIALPFVALIQGTLSPHQYFLQVALTLLAFFALQRLFVIAYRQFKAAEKPRALDYLLLTVPIVRHQQQRDVLASLALLWGAGIALLEALAITRANTTNQELWLRLAAVIAAVKTNTPLAQALADATVLADPAMVQLIAAGQTTGRLDEMLQRCVSHLDEQLKDQLDSLAEWLPRLMYVVVLGVLFL